MIKKSAFLLTFLFLIIFILSACTQKNSTANQNQKANAPSPSKDVATGPTSSPPPVEINFSGEYGDKLTLNNGKTEINTSLFNEGKAHFFNTELSSGKTVYFFVVKDSDGRYRAAANACQVCHASKAGFKQVGDYMVCNTCQQKYPMNKIALEKGGCNPIPINPNLTTQGGKIVIEERDLSQVTSYF